MSDIVNAIRTEIQRRLAECHKTPQPWPDEVQIYAAAYSSMLLFVNQEIAKNDSRSVRGIIYRGIGSGIFIGLAIVVFRLIFA